MIKSLKEMIEAARSTGKKKLAVAAANELDVLTAVEQARKENIIDGILIGDKSSIESACSEAGLNPGEYKIIDIKAPKRAAIECCRLIHKGDADFMMKGAIKTSDFMKAILDRQAGLSAGGLLSHVAVFEIESMDRLLFVTDAAINIYPDISEKAMIIQNAVNIARNIGYDRPKVASLGAVEVVNAEKMPDTIESATLSKMAERGQIEGCDVDGPLALDVAVSMQAVETKGLKSNVAGKADILVAPEIISANVLYKSLTYLAGAQAAAIVTGTIAPVILTSRADDHTTKFLSIVLGAAGVKSEG
ncbi:MAG: bifunctional enoyl-CoA hydratase/phosphate acetyltransferase [candidate division Zixibacteria bacterium]|nr:bifunctional enoyl-CoA hydratase/phosphate acetyltransferase [candidate division Zixibacteria bacterium]